MLGFVIDRTGQHWGYSVLIRESGCRPVMLRDCSAEERDFAMDLVQSLDPTGWWDQDHEGEADHIFKGLTVFASIHAFWYEDK